MPKILDACCGSRLFWFDKDCSFATYMDIREEEYEIHEILLLSQSRSTIRLIWSLLTRIVAVTVTPSKGWIITIA